LILLNIGSACHGLFEIKAAKVEGFWFGLVALVVCHNQTHS